MPSFSMTRPRCDSAVLALTESIAAISFVVLPSAMSWSTSRSRGVRGSLGSSDLSRYACTAARETLGLR
jgi:hypothetical protein